MWLWLSASRALLFSVLQNVCIVTCHYLEYHLLLGITGSWLGLQHRLLFLGFSLVLCFSWFCLETSFTL